MGPALDVLPEDSASKATSAWSVSTAISALTVSMATSALAVSCHLSVTPSPARILRKDVL